MHRRLVGPLGPRVAAQAGEVARGPEAGVAVADDLVHEWVEMGVHGGVADRMSNEFRNEVSTCT